MNTASMITVTGGEYIGRAALDAARLTALGHAIAGRDGQGDGQRPESAVGQPQNPSPPSTTTFK